MDNSIISLSQEEKQFLLQFARKTLVAYLDKGDKLKYQCDAPALLQLRAAFVTLRKWKTGELRGCRGEVFASQPLIQSVANNTIASATDDPRFTPVELEEVPDLHIEISALTPLYPIKPENVEVGKHGLLIMKDRHRGLLLPEVPVHYNWDRETYLRALCYKAGLQEDTWHEVDMRLFAFEAEVWSEGEITI